jgi:hypothetical protein
MSLTSTEWAILNATADDMENLEQIYRTVCLEYFQDNHGSGHWRERKPLVCLADIAEGIRRLLGEGFLVPIMDEEGSPWTDMDDVSVFWRAWFQMTQAGRDAWSSSEHCNT